MRPADNAIASPDSDDSRLNRRWDVIVVGILVNACLGTVYSWSIFRPPLEELLTITAAQSGIPYSVFLGAFAFTMPLAGSFVSRFGTRMTLVVGGALLGLGWIGAGLSSSLPMMIVTYGVIGGAGVGFAYGVPLVVAASWFPAKRGFAMGVTLAGFGVSPFVTAPLAELLIRRFGVSEAMVILGAVFAGIVWLLSPMLRRRDDPEESLDEGTGDSSRDSERAENVYAALQRRDVKPADMLRSPRFYGLWVCYVFGTLAGLTAIGMTASFGQEAVSITATAAAAAVSAFGILNGVGRPLFGAIHDTIGTRLTVVIAFALISLAAATSLLAAGGSVVFFYVGFGIFWLMLGGWLAIAPAATVRLFGARYYGRNYGIMYTAYGLGALAGGFVAGALHTRHGSFAPLFIFVIGLCAAGIVVALLTLPGRRGA